MKRAKTRSAFTLIELLVAMAIIIFLAALALIVVPDIMAQDRTTDGASSVRQWLMISKNRAARDGLPRGIRLIYGMDPNNLRKTNAAWVTEIQNIEAPPVMIPSPNPTGNPNDPHVRIEYTLNTGAIANRRYYLMNLPVDPQATMQADIAQARHPVISLPILGTWHKITSMTALAAPQGNGNDWEVTFDAAYSPDPDDFMGAATHLVTFHFGIYGAPRPLLGDPVLQLPANICVDLSVSYPPSTGADYDVLFAPNGQVVGTPNISGVGQIYLWVRDYTKTPNPLVLMASPPNPAGTYDLAPFRNGGEQQLVAIKTKSGSMGVFPVAWPDLATGQYAAGQDYYSLARRGASAP